MNRYPRLHDLLVPTLIAVLAVTLGACSSSRRATRDNLTRNEIPADVTRQNPQQRYSELCGSYGDWEDVTLPLRVNVTAPKSLSVSARATMTRGKSISISVRMLSFEVASVYADSDSLHVADRYHKAYLSESLAKVFGGDQVSITDIQDLLLGRGFVAGAAGGTFTPTLSKAIKLEPTSEGLMILPARQPAGFEYGFIMAPDFNRIAAATVTVGQNHGAVATYADPTLVAQSGTFAATTSIETIGEKKIAAQLQWNFQSAKWNTGVSNKWKTPSGYRRLDGAALMASLSKL